MLMAVVDANLEFIYTDVGQYRRHADGGICRECSLNANMNAKTAHLLKPAALPGTQIFSPYVFVGDSAFPLTENLQCPYCRREMNEPQMIFNYRLSRALCVIENAFGVMSNRFRCLLSNLQLLPDTVTTVVRASCLLHNFLRRKCGSGYITEALVRYHGRIKSSTLKFCFVNI